MSAHATNLQDIHRYDEEDIIDLSSDQSLHQDPLDPLDQEEDDQDSQSLLTTRHKLVQKLRYYQKKTPLLRRLPFRVVAIISLLILVQCAAWIVAGLVLTKHPSLIGTAAIAWTLGLRHALDADHISCIDMMTRRLIAAGQRPVTVGTFFSLGHSTIVIITCVVVAATSSEAVKHFNGFSRVGGIVGSSVSAAFLLLLGLMNLYILRKLWLQLQSLIRTPPGHRPEFNQLQMGAGCFVNLIHKLFRFVDTPWKIFPVGVMFGLGFDTSSEVALLGISALQASKGTSLWYILTFPMLFTAGMCLVDTTDGALMMSLYTSAASDRDPFTVTYYSLVLTGVTVVVALFIGTLQALELADAVLPNPQGRFWDAIGYLGDAYDIIGIALSFIQGCLTTGVD
jgi:nickel/cobalt transporter (NiCoT) family protein